MSETEQERESEIVVGTVQGIEQKAADKWQVIVLPDGSQYPKKIWTKSGETVQRLQGIFGERRAFECNVSHWTNQSGQPVRSLWLEHVSESGAADVGASPVPSQGAAAPRPRVSAPEKEVDWDAKERRDYRSRAWAQTISAFAHTIEREESMTSVYNRLYSFQRKVYRDIVRELDTEAFPDDDIPFD